MRLLVVEDNFINQQVARELLEAEGASVQLADNGRLGVDAVAAAKPQFESVARNAVDEDAGTCNATPAFSNGQMFLRTNRYLYCIARK